MNEKLNFGAAVGISAIILLLRIIEYLFGFHINNNFYMLLAGILIASVGNLVVAKIQKRKNTNPD